MARKVVVVDQDVAQAALGVPSSESVASRKVVEAFPPAVIDALLEQSRSSGVAVDGPDGLLAQMTKAVLERALGAEMTDHLGYEHGDLKRPRFSGHR